MNAEDISSSIGKAPVYTDIILYFTFSRQYSEHEAGRTRDTIKWLVDQGHILSLGQGDGNYIYIQKTHNFQEPAVKKLIQLGGLISRIEIEKTNPVILILDILSDENIILRLSGGSSTIRHIFTSAINIIYEDQMPFAVAEEVLDNISYVITPLGIDEARILASVFQSKFLCNFVDNTIATVSV